MYKNFTCDHYGKTYYNSEEFHIEDVVFKISTLEHIIDFCRQKNIKNIFCIHVFPEWFRKKYSDINFFFNEPPKNTDRSMRGWKDLKQFNMHRDINIKNFLCSFNGSQEVGRQFFVSMLKKQNLFNVNYCTKNFEFTEQTIDGNIEELSNNPVLHHKFIKIEDDSDNFYQTKYTIDYEKFDHLHNINCLQEKITESFLNLVCESFATGELVAITEKCLFSVVCRGLFLCYAPQNWHNVFEKYYGFRNYTNLFNYHFDTIENPVERLVELVSMIQKFSSLSVRELSDLYELETPTIEYNYDHFFSGKYLDCINEYEDTFNTEKQL